jgi:hypothetical protein
MPAYSLDEAVITVGGVRMAGFGESDAISWKKVTDDWDPVDCCDGATVHNKIQCRRGEVTLTFRYDSTAHRTLAGFADAASAVSFNCVLGNGRVVESGEARVLKRPESSFGAKTGDEVWVLSCVPLRVTYELGGGV